MPETFIPPIPPSPGTRNKPELKILKAEFGDGYTQTTPDGLNHIRAVYSLSWEVLTPAQAASMESFMERHLGTKAFLYQPAGRPAPMLFTCEEWERKMGTPEEFTATFRQSFNIT